MKKALGTIIYSAMETAGDVHSVGSLSDGSELRSSISTALNEETCVVTSGECRPGSRVEGRSTDAFVAIRISSPQIRSSLERIQNSMTAVESRLGAAMVSLDKLHLTLMVLRLGEEEERIAR